MIKRYSIRLLIASTLVVSSLQAASTASATIIMPTKRPQKAILTPNNTIFAFDIHNVLLQRNYTNLAWHLTSWKGLEFVSKLAAHKLGFESELSKKFTEIRKQDSSAESYINTFKDTDPDLANLFKNLGNDYSPMPTISALLAQLHKQKYPLIIASDIGPTMLEYARETNPDLFAFFIQAQVVSYNGASTFIDPVSISPYQKPNILFFELFQQRFNPAGEKTIIFIDDKRKNVDAAVQAGMIGIVFETVGQLKNDLNSLGITAQ